MVAVGVAVAVVVAVGVVVVVAVGVVVVVAVVVGVVVGIGPANLGEGQMQDVESVLRDIRIVLRETDVEAVRWQQYTPDDGDGFLVTTPEFRREDTEEWIPSYSPTDSSEEAVNEIGNLLEDMPDALLAAFGDGAEVTITRGGGVSVDAYDPEG